MTSAFARIWPSFHFLVTCWQPEIQRGRSLIYPYVHIYIYIPYIHLCISVLELRPCAPFPRPRTGQFFFFVVLLRDELGCLWDHCGASSDSLKTSAIPRATFLMETWKPVFFDKRKSKFWKKMDWNWFQNWRKIKILHTFTYPLPLSQR